MSTGLLRAELFNNFGVFFLDRKYWFVRSISVNTECQLQDRVILRTKEKQPSLLLFHKPKHSCCQSPALGLPPCSHRPSCKMGSQEPLEWDPWLWVMGTGGAKLQNHTAALGAPPPLTAAALGALRSLAPGK